MQTQTIFKTVNAVQTSSRQKWSRINRQCKKPVVKVKSTYSHSTSPKWTLNARIALFDELIKEVGAFGATNWNNLRPVNVTKAEFTQVLERVMLTLRNQPSLFKDERVPYRVESLQFIIQRAVKTENSAVYKAARINARVAAEIAGFMKPAQIVKLSSTNEFYKIVAIADSEVSDEIWDYLESN